jgi:hypothetical protein
MHPASKQMAMSRSLVIALRITGGIGESGIPNLPPNAHRPSPHTTLHTPPLYAAMCHPPKCALLSELITAHHLV